MTIVNPNDYGGTDLREKLTPEVLGNPEMVVLIIEEARTGIETGDGRKAAFLVFEEYPDHAYWLNKRGVTALVARFGGDDSEWIGESVPLVRVHTSNPTTCDPVVAFHVAPPREWDDILGDPDADGDVAATSHD